MKIFIVFIEKYILERLADFNICFVLIVNFKK